MLVSISLSYALVAVSTGKLIQRCTVTRTNVGSQTRSVPSSEQDATNTELSLTSFDFLSRASWCFSCHDSTSTAVAQSTDSTSYIHAHSYVCNNVKSLSTFWAWNPTKMHSPSRKMCGQNFKTVESKCSQDRLQIKYTLCSEKTHPYVCFYIFVKNV